MEVCDVWLARDFLRRTRRPLDIPPCQHSPSECPPIREGADEMTTTPNDNAKALALPLNAFLAHAKEEGVFLVQWKGAQTDWHVLTDDQRAELLAEWKPSDPSPERTVMTALTTLADALAELAAVKRQYAEHVCNPTQWAYNAACAALHKHRDRADTAVAVLDEIGDTVFRFGAASDPDAVRDLLVKTQQRAKEAVAVDKRVRETPPAKS
jgi:hypothetical protein